MRFRIKPIVVDAEQYIGRGEDLSDEWKAVVKMDMLGTPWIGTPEGVYGIAQGDYIVRNEKNEFRLREQNDFLARYEVEVDVPGALTNATEEDFKSGPTEEEIAIAAYCRYKQRTENPQNDEDVAVDDLSPEQGAVNDWDWAVAKLGEL